MMKTQIGLYLGAGTAEQLREAAHSAGASIGDLADLLLRYGLSKVPPEQLRAWALKLPSTKGRLAGQLTKDERAVLGAFETLPKKAGQDGVWRFPITDVAAEAGLRLTEAYWALKALQRRALVRGMELEELDRWGRPVKSYWSLISAMPEHARPKA